ncbi:diguanylate cyclase domain-containing protein [Noviherbaspirillum galbum]|uniref:diguanylate cyclase n=1 Tax=Noviherbaspirillum galbum TaxID=2709383 RepID=A0A6B3SI80_9BURK|nr:diguanylate cyclase [Noviherbaspirillum galbum]NEX60557.1 diguanylate cyclase [Noviherbaspirillum galbum]
MTSVADKAPEAALQGPPVRVLLVDDQMLIAEAVRRMLAGQPDIAFHAETRPEHALDTAARWQPTVILLDLVMPGIHGFDLVRCLRGHAATQDVPIIMLSSREEAVHKVQGFAVGANDYLVKLPDQQELLARLRYHSRAYRNQLERDQAFAALRESERRLAEANVQLQRLADIDGLTGIANRRRFDSALQVEWQRALRTQRPLSVLLGDVDHFKAYNDTYGHLAGDRCLQQVAAVLNANLRRPADVAARYGGEEFALILPETENAGAAAVAQSCLAQVAALGIAHAGSSAAEVVTMSFGVATLVPAQGQATPDLLTAADRALYRAKAAGRNQAGTAG